MWTLTKYGHRFALTLAVVAVMLGAAFAPSSVYAQDDWPSERITIVVPFNAGGSADRMARTLAEPLGEELGVPVVVENRPGGSGGMGATYVAQQPADGNTLLLMQATPYLANAILVGGAPVEWEDFRFLNAQWNDYGIFAVHKDSEYETLDQLIAAMREAGGVSSGIIYGNAGHVQTLALMQEFGIPKDNLRFVTYDGGAPLRSALAGNQVDFEVLAAQAASSIMDRLRVLAIAHDSDPDELGAPLLNDVVTGMGKDPLPLIGGNITGLLMPAALQEQHPSRYQQIVDAYERVVKSDAYTEAAEEAGVGHDWVGPEKSQAIVDEAYAALTEFTELVK